MIDPALAAMQQAHARACLAEMDLQAALEEQAASPAALVLAQYPTLTQPHAKRPRRSRSRHLGQSSFGPGYFRGNPCILMGTQKLGRDTSTADVRKHCKAHRPKMGTLRELSQTFPLAAARLHCKKI